MVRTTSLLQNLTSAGPFTVGELVRNFGNTCEVLGYHPADPSTMFVEDVRTGERWGADPARCERIAEGPVAAPLSGVFSAAVVAAAFGA